MDENLNNAKDNLNEAKSDVKASITEHIEQIKTQVNDHVDHLSDKTKEVIVDVAQAVKKAAEAVEGKLTKEQPNSLSDLKLSEAHKFVLEVCAILAMALALIVGMKSISSTVAFSSNFQQF